ncbi:TSUP family transporter [Zhongshania guokunii]|uniref:Probable membrane transporter protein n=1 Tax=Zhongshania guokunii TaxID=641783 RepID=A0ABV3U2F6_9GAMM
MADLALYQYLLIGIIFIWSGFVRSGLGFGGAVLSLPFLLLVDNQPLVFLPLISVQLLIFSSITLVLNNRSSQSIGREHASTVDWPYLRYMLGIMIVPKLLGVLGLITLPADTLSIIIFSIVSIYAISYMVNKPFKSNSKFIDAVFLIVGGYISGTSLIGAPLIIAVAAQHVAREQLRDTLFALWFIFVAIKLGAFIYAGIDLQLIHHLWLLPCAGIGHVIGLRFHRHMLKAETPLFFRFLGGTLLAISMLGLWRALI